MYIYEIVLTIPKNSKFFAILAIITLSAIIPTLNNVSGQLNISKANLNNTGLKSDMVIDSTTFNLTKNKVINSQVLLDLASGKVIKNTIHEEPLSQSCDINIIIIHTANGEICGIEDGCLKRSYSIDCGAVI